MSPDAAKHLMGVKSSPFENYYSWRKGLRFPEVMFSFVHFVVIVIRLGGSCQLHSYSSKLYTYCNNDNHY